MILILFWCIIVNNSNMSKQHNYDTKSSIFDIDYKIPYEISEGSMIIEQL